MPSPSTQDDVTTVHDLTEDEGDARPDAEEARQRALGARLRQARRARGLTLQEVEQRSDGRWKAVVIGSYERGDRAVSAARLAELAAFLDVDVADLLRDEPPGRAGGPLGAVRFDVEALQAAAANDPELEPFVRLVDHVRWQRGDHRSGVLAVRHDDLASVALLLGTDGDQLEGWLAERGVLAG